MNLSEASKRYKLSDFNLESLLGLLDKLVVELKKTKKKSIYYFTKIDIQVLDSFMYELPVYIDVKMNAPAAIGGDRDIPVSYKNIALIVNPTLIQSKKQLYNSLYHELIHAQDPTLTIVSTPKYVEKYGDPDERPDLYYSHGIELRAITGEFFEALVNEYKERVENIKDEKDKHILLNSLDNIISFFNELNILSPLAYNILDEMNGENDLDKKFKKILSKMMLDYPKVSEFFDESGDKEPYYLACIDLIRRFSDKGWRSFLRMLYTTSQEIRDMINKKITERYMRQLVRQKIGEIL